MFRFDLVKEESFETEAGDPVDLTSAKLTLLDKTETSLQFSEGVENGLSVNIGIGSLALSGAMMTSLVGKHRDFRVKIAVVLKNEGGVILTTEEEDIEEFKDGVAIILRDHGEKIKGLISVTGVARRKTWWRKMLDQGLYSDARIVVLEDGEEKQFPCHRLILSQKSVVFDAMFDSSSSGMLERTTGSIKVSDMSSKSVKAFLNFIYFGELDSALRDSRVTLDLLRAGSLYQIKDLFSEMKKVIMAKPDKWFDLEVVMELFFFTRIHPQSVTLMKKALAVMSKNYAALNSTGAYSQLFRDAPDAAQTLSKALIEYNKKL